MGMLAVMNEGPERGKKFDCHLIHDISRKTLVLFLGLDNYAAICVNLLKPTDTRDATGGGGRKVFYCNKWCIK